MLQTKFNEKINGIIKHHQVNDGVFAVGVSGGADSLALVLLAREWAKKNKKKIVALTVDHKLRAESGAEAVWVGEVMQKYGIEHHVLVWGGKKPQKSMEEAARNARYNLMKKWCYENGVKTLLIAHHKLDQAETFLMRLQRGSGIDGLSGIAEYSGFFGLNLLRPLLGFEPGHLKDFLKKNKLKWVEDPHNEMDDFLRVRVRKIIPILDDKIGLSIDRIVDTQKVLQRARDYFADMVAEFVKSYVKFWGDFGVSFAVDDFKNQHVEMQYRIVSKLIREVGDNDYVSRAASVDALLEAVNKKGFKGSTLGGCEIVAFKGKIFVIKEIRKIRKISKKEWEEFVVDNKKYANLDLPYKLKMLLCS